jgi:hypothetical protein
LPIVNLREEPTLVQPTLVQRDFIRPSDVHSFVVSNRCTTFQEG